MKMKLLSGLLTAVVAALAPAADDYVVTVAANATNTVDAAFVAELGAAGRLVKRGAGVLKSTAALKDYAGEIVVEEGVLLVPETGAVGTTANTGYVTVSNGATVVFAATTANGIKCGKKVVRIAGDGAEGEEGALVFNGAALLQEGCLRYITLLEDAKLRASSEFTLYNGVLDMNGNTLTISVRNKDGNGQTSWEYNLTFNRSVVKNPGNMVLTTGKLVIGGAPSGANIPYWDGGEANTFTLDPSTKLQFSATVTPIPWKLVMQNFSGVMSSSDHSAKSPYNNAWHGPLDINGSVSFSYNNKRIGAMNMLGPIGGTGGFSCSGYTTLHLWNTNSYAGDTSISSANGNHMPVHLHCGRAFPINSKGVMVNDCDVPLHGEDFYELPVMKMQIAGERKITGAISGGTMAGLVKTGAGVLDYDSMVTVTGRTEVLEGVLRLCVHSPRRQVGGIRQGERQFDSDSYSNPGANYYWSNHSKTIPETTRILDSLHYAYTTIQPLWATKHAMARYEGYIWNDSPTNETWSFMSGIQNRGKLWINDKSVLTQGSYEVAEFKQAELVPGANHFIYSVYFAATATGGGGGNKPAKYYDFDNGSEIREGLNWVQYKGFAFNRSGKKSFDHSDYETLENLMDGALVTVTNDLSELTSRIAGSFSNVFVSASASLDIGNPSMLVSIPEFSGEGTVTNGILEVGERLVVRADEVASSPLKFVDAELRFAGNAVVSVDDMTALSRERQAGNPYVIAVADRAFAQTPKTDPELEEARWKVELSKDSCSMLMYYVPRGLAVTIR